MTTKDNKGAAEKIAKDALQLSDEDLLRDIFHQYNIAFSKNDPAQINRTIAYFSALLIKLSRQAEDSTKKIVKLTKILTYLTWVIAIFTAILLLIGFFEFPKKPILQNQNMNQTNKDTQQNKTNEPNKANNKNHK